MASVGVDRKTNQQRKRILKMKTATEQQAKHEPGPWITHGDLIGTAKCDWWHEGNELVIARALRYGGTRPTDANARLIAAAPELLEACKFALELIKTARNYFPKSIQNRDKFTLENTCATLGKAIHHAEMEPCPTTPAK